MQSYLLSRNPLYLRPWSCDNRSDAKWRWSRWAEMIFYRVKSVSHFSISCFSLETNAVGGKKGGIQTSRRYGVEASTKTTLGHPPLSDTFHLRTRPWGTRGSCAGWCGATIPRESPMAALGIGATPLLHVVHRLRTTLVFRLLSPRYAVTMDAFTKCECLTLLRKRKSLDLRARTF